MYTDQMFHLLAKLGLSQRTCVYCDVRIEETAESQIVIQNGELTACQTVSSLGAFVRVFNNGRWFYCSTTAVSELDAVLAKLIAQSETLCGVPVVEPLWEPPGHVENRSMTDDKNVEIAGADHPLGLKRQLCLDYAGLIEEFPTIANFELNYRDMRKIKYFASSTGVSFSATFQQYGFNLNYTLKGENGAHFSDRFNCFGSCFEDLRGFADQLRESIRESHAFLTAPIIVPGTYRMILNNAVVGVFAHESFGHKSEADFMIGEGRAMAEWAIGKVVGSPVLSIVDDGLLEGTSGYCPIDDEGTPAERTYLIKHGILCGRLHSLETAKALGECPTGNARAVNFEFEPIVRMTATYVEPGDLDFAAMLALVPDGIYVKDFRYGTGMSTFTIAPRKCYRIRDGRIAEPVRVNVISGSVFETLQNVEACSNDLELFSSAVGGCGKIEQWPLPVSFGGPKVLVSAMTAS